MQKKTCPRKTRNRARNDILFIAILSMVAILCLLLLKNRPANTQTAVVRVDGTAVLTIPLAQAGDYPLDTGYGHIIISVESAQVRIRSSDCPDQLCVRQGPLPPAAPPLCCLPNHVTIQYAAPDAPGAYDILIGGLP